MTRAAPCNIIRWEPAHRHPSGSNGHLFLCKRRAPIGDPLSAGRYVVPAGTRLRGDHRRPFVFENGTYVVVASMTVQLARTVDVGLDRPLTRRLRHGEGGVAGWGDHSVIMSVGSRFASDADAIPDHQGQSIYDQRWPTWMSSWFGDQPDMIACEPGMLAPHVRLLGRLS